MGIQRALVVHGDDGLDEISLSASTDVAEIEDGVIKQYRVRPEDFNLKEEPIENLRVSSKEESRSAAMGVIRGDMNAASKIVCLNAAAALYICGKVPSIKAGILTAMDVLENGRVEKKLKQIVQFSQKA